MTLLAKLYSWPGSDSLIRDTEWTAEFNQILNLINGGTSNRRGYTLFSDGSLPAWRYNQTGAGPVVEFQVAGTTKVSVNNSGQLVSAVATGTAPITVSSTTVCTNLNADKLDGVEGSGYVLNSSGSQQVKSSFRLAKASSGEDMDFALDANTLTVKRSSDSATLFTMSSLSSATRILNFPSTLNVTSDFTPTASTDVIRVADASNYRIKEFADRIATPAVSTRYGTFIAPAAGTATSLNSAFYTKGTSITVQVHKNEVSQGSIANSSSDAVNTTYSSNIADFSFVADDRISFYVSAISGTWGDYIISLLMTV